MPISIDGDGSTGNTNLIRNTFRTEGEVNLNNEKLNIDTGKHFNLSYFLLEDFNGVKLRTEHGLYIEGLEGEGIMTLGNGAINCFNKRITNVSKPVEDKDCVNKEYVDTKLPQSLIIHTSMSITNVVNFIINTIPRINNTKIPYSVKINTVAYMSLLDAVNSYLLFDISQSDLDFIVDNLYGLYTIQIEYGDRRSSILDRRNTFTWNMKKVGNLRLYEIYNATPYNFIFSYNDITKKIVLTDNHANELDTYGCILDIKIIKRLF